jgi:pilus assembly protein CpaB
MRAIFGLVLVVGLALAGAAVYMAKGYINRTETALQQELRIKAKTGGLVEVFVVSKPMTYGDPLTKDSVQKIYWPRNALPEGVFIEDAALFPEGAPGPRYMTRETEKFEPVLAVKVTEPGVPPGLTGDLAKGMRAFAIRVDAADFLQTGDRVDVYWTGSLGNSQGDMTRLIESGMKIIAVDRKMKKSSTEGEITSRTMTVAATPEQVARLAQAQATGRLVMSLVGIGDTSEAGLVEVDSKKLLGVAEAAPAAAVVEEKVCTIKTRKGADVIETPIPCTN